jgi:predicted Zn-dependent protease
VCPQYVFLVWKLFGGGGRCIEGAVVGMTVGVLMENGLGRREFLLGMGHLWGRAITVGGAFGLLAGGSCGCRSVPGTDRKQLLLLPESQEVSVGAQAFSQVTSESPESTNLAMTNVVKRVGERIAQHADRPDYDWEFRLLASPEMNAFCLPGGKVAIHEGILPVCQNEAGLAVVMSHEIAHALARHGGERMSQSMAAQGVEQVVNRLAKKHVPSREELLMQAYGLGSQYLVLLPYSRKHESEADEIGLKLMSRAGYDPAEAPRFWGRFASMNDGEQTLEFLSTHPSDERRQKDLLAQMEQARVLYMQSSKLGLGQSLV